MYCHLCCFKKKGLIGTNVILSGITNNIVTESEQQQKKYKKLLRKIMNINNILTIKQHIKYVCIFIYLLPMYI